MRREVEGGVIVRSQIWVSKGTNLRPLPRNQEDEIMGQWKPPREHTPHLTSYLMALPGFRYREEGVRVIATDVKERKGGTIAVRPSSVK